jgi:hypothetical protein
MNLNATPSVTADQSGLLVTRALAESIPSHGVTVWSELMHPVYEAVAEVREMPNGMFAIWHHHGDALMAWQDEVAPLFHAKDDAVNRVRAYQRVFAAPALH